MTDHPYEKWLDGVRNPSQYIGNEVHSVTKDPAGLDCRLALCFPDLYRIGMSHLGMKILYSIINAKANLCAERFFMPEPDLAAILGENGEPLRSLESHDPLSAFDVVGFSITTELSFTSILKILDLGGVPLKQAERGEGDPLVIGGGAAIYNPEPIADFFDLFILGEAEEILPEILCKLADYKKKGLTRAEILRKLAALKGVYVPSLFKVTYSGLAVKEISPTQSDTPVPTRVFLADLESSPYPFDMVIPYGQPVFDRLSVEIDRGCTQACRFCQAGFTYRPARERSVESVLAIVEKGLKATGFDDVSLASLSSGDYANIDTLITKLADATVDDRVSLSIPSLRSGTLSDNLIEQVRRVRKTGFTITAEAGTERLRNVINKKISDTEIIETARKLLKGGWRKIKIYFMIGLPTETDEDIDGIVRLVKKIKGLNEDGKRFQAINVGVSQFVPKPHTPFQWEPMESPASLLEKKRLLLAAFGKMRGVKVKGHDVEQSCMESIFARGDRRLAAVILNAFKKGCQLDEWSEHHRPDLWAAAFREESFSPDDFTHRRRGEQEVLPWDHLDIGVNKKYLLRELAYAKKGETTGDCRFEKCLACGIDPCDMVLNEPVADTVSPTDKKAPVKKEQSADYRYRMGFRKQSTARYLSHLELIAAFTRAIRRASLPISYSLGMHPHPRLSFGAAVSVGVISLCEQMDIGLDENIDPEEIRARLNAELENGLIVDSVSRIFPPYRSIQAQTTATIYELVDSAPTVPPMEEVREAALALEGVTVSEPQKNCLRFETKNPGILGRLKKAVPGFCLSDRRKLTKTAIVLKENDPKRKVYSNKMVLQKEWD